MVKLAIITVFFLILAAIMYGVCQIPPVKRKVQRFTRKRLELLVTLAIGIFVALAMYFIILPRVG